MRWAPRDVVTQGVPPRGGPAKWRVTSTSRAGRKQHALKCVAIRLLEEEVRLHGGGADQWRILKRFDCLGMDLKIRHSSFAWSHHVRGD